MIIDTLDNIRFYEKQVKGISKGYDALQMYLKVAKEEVDGEKNPFEGGYFMIQNGTTKPLEEGTFESHRKYIDVQIVLEGAEEMAWAPLKELTEAISYNEQKDVIRLNGERTHHMLISEGMFYVAFPEDGHKAISHTEHPHTYRKCVMKIACL